MLVAHCWIRNAGEHCWIRNVSERIAGYAMLVVTAEVQVDPSWLL